VRTGLTAEAAVERVPGRNPPSGAAHGDPILRERAHDFDICARRLLRQLTGEKCQRPQPAAEYVLVARAWGGRASGLWPRQSCGPVLEEAAVPAMSHRRPFDGTCPWSPH